MDDTVKVIVEDLEKDVIKAHEKLEKQDEDHELLGLVKITGVVLLYTLGYNNRYHDNTTEGALKLYLSELEQAITQ